MAGGLVGALMWLLLMDNFTDRVGEGVEITNKTFNCILHAGKVRVNRQVFKVLKRFLFLTQ